MAVATLSAPLAACGGNDGGETADGGAGDLKEVSLQGYDVSVSVPKTWRVTGDERAKEAERYPGWVDGTALTATAPGGRTGVVLSASPVEPGFTLERRVREALRELQRTKEQQPQLGLEIEGTGQELVELADGDAWRLRLSNNGAEGREQLLQYTFVRDGLLVTCSYMTREPYERFAGVFERSSRTIRIGDG